MSRLAEYDDYGETCQFCGHRAQLFAEETAICEDADCWLEYLKEWEDEK